MEKIKIPKEKLRGEEEFKTFSIRIPNELYYKLNDLCSKTELSRNEVITILLKEASDVAEIEGKLVGSCVCQIIPNLTHGMRPYAVIENVVTDEAFRRQGIATACLHFAREEARAAGCYKLMLSTGSKKEETLRFYEKAGYNLKINGCRPSLHRFI